MKSAATTAIPSLVQALGYYFRLLGLVRRYWGRLLAGMLVTLALSILGLVPPILTKVLIDDVYPARDVTLLHVVLLGTAGISIASAIIGAIRTYYTQVVGGELGTSMSLMFFNHIVHQPVSFFDNQRTGAVLSRFSDVRSSLASVTRIFETLVSSGAQVLIVPPVLFWLNWKLALLSLATLPLTTVVSLTAGRSMRRLGKQTAEGQAELSGFHVDMLSQIRTIKLLSAEHSVFSSASAQSQQLFRVQLKSTGLGALVNVCRSFIAAAGTAVFMLYGWRLILAGELTLGGFLAFSAYLRFMTGPLSSLTSLFSDFQQTAVALGRMFEYLDSEPEIDPSGAYVPRSVVSICVSGALRCRNLNYSYPSGRQALCDVSFEIPQFSSLAIVGPSGAGKSSLVRLLARLSSPDAGEISIGSTNVRSIPLHDYRRQIGVVWQEVGLVRGTLLHNLTIGNEGVDRSRIERALEICQLAEMVRALPEGLETPVAEWGATLSGGQRQRLAIARALMRDASFLLLDEATSNIDPTTERLIMRGLLGTSTNTTTLFVTHRIQNAALADNICVVSDGRVVGFGTYEELLASCEVFRRMSDSHAVVSDVQPLHIVSSAGGRQSVQHASLAVIAQ